MNLVTSKIYWENLHLKNCDRYSPYDVGILGIHLCSLQTYYELRDKTMMQRRVVDLDFSQTVSREFLAHWSRQLQAISFALASAWVAQFQILLGIGQKPAVYGQMAKAHKTPPEWLDWRAPSAWTFQSHSIWVVPVCLLVTFLLFGNLHQYLRSSILVNIGLKS